MIVQKNHYLIYFISLYTLRDGSKIKSSEVTLAIYSLLPMRGIQMTALFYQLGRFHKGILHFSIEYFE